LPRQRLQLFGGHLRVRMHRYRIEHVHGYVRSSLKLYYRVQQ
jgi:hypothetical protein